MPHKLQIELLARSPLKGFQSAFVKSLLAADEDIPAFFQCAGQNIVDQRFNIYRNNVFSSLIQALRDGFPVVQRLVGAEFFAALAQEYIKNNMPSSPVMMNYGAGFPDFLKTFPPVASLAYLSDLAQLEWYYNEAFHSADAQSVTMESVLEVAQERLSEVVLVCHPALRCIQSDYAVLSIWQVHKEGISDEAIEMPEVDAREEVLLTRPVFEVELHWLQSGGVVFVTALQQGKPLGTVITDITALYPNFDLQQMLSTLFESGAISGFNFKNETK